MSIELKIKSKHLALEPAIIRHEERKLRKRIRANRNYQDNKTAEALESKWYSLYTHRKWDVRNEARATHLTRAYLAGKSYKSVEKTCYNNDLLKNVIVPRIVSMVMKYGPTTYLKTWDRDQKKAVYSSYDLIKVRDEILTWIEKE